MRPDVTKHLLRVELVYALPDRQALIELDVGDGKCVADVIRLSGIEARFPEDDLGACDVGIWGKVVARDTPVSDGDRIEIYRRLEMNPRDARRLRAKGSD